MFLIVKEPHDGGYGGEGLKLDAFGFPLDRVEIALSREQAIETKKLFILM